MNDTEKLARGMCWARRDHSDPDWSCPCESPADCECTGIEMRDAQRLCKIFNITPEQALSLLNGTSFIVPVIPSDAEIGAVTQAILKELPVLSAGTSRMEIACIASKAMRDAVKGEG